MKKNNKYTYVRGTQAMEHGSRIYDFNGMRMPSVTTILSKTKDQSFLTEDSWHLRMICELAGRDADYVRQKIRKKLLET